MDTLISRGQDTTKLNTSIANLEAQMSKIIKQNEDPIKEELRRKAGTPTIGSGTLDLEGGQGVVGGGGTNNTQMNEIFRLYEEWARNNAPDPENLTGTFTPTQ